MAADGCTLIIHLEIGVVLTFKVARFLTNAVQSLIKPLCFSIVIRVTWHNESLKKRIEITERKQWYFAAIEMTNDAICSR